MSAVNYKERMTRRHYDEHPLEFLTEANERQIRDIQPAPFLRFVEDLLPPGARVADIGCGPGRGTMFLSARGYQVIALDISETSIGLARKRAPLAAFVNGSNLALPFGNAIFDAVVSDGVIHHTPDARKSFRENARILKPGGKLYLGVYNRKRYYYYLYTYVGRPIRWMARHRAGRLALRTTLLPVYYLIHLFKSGGTRSWTGAENFFYDYFITPQASFHTRAEVEAWGEAEGLHLHSYDPSLGNIHVFVFEKRTGVAR